MKNSQKGFTLIELLVVIAIIGILATIVLTSLGSAQSKAKDSKISGQLSSMRAQAQLMSAVTAAPSATCASTTGSIIDSANTSSLYPLLAGITHSGGSVTCAAYGSATTAPSSGGTWAVAVNNSSGGSYCVDYTGTSKLLASTVAGSAINTTAHTCN